jgi:CheY-like chemotaxis protein
VFVIDITEHKRMEEALLKSEKLKSIGTLAAGVSHEFNNILAIISGNAQLLMETYKDHVGLTKALSTIKKVVDDGAQISRKMLQFTKIKNDTEGFVLFDIRDLITQSIDFTSPRWKNEAQANGIDYQINKDGMKSVSSIMCNSSELREVFINIINNALDAMPDGGKLSFSTWSGDNTLFVSISDTGEGMSEETKRSVFDPFFTTKMAVGTGLGMSLTYGIISEHGGDIEVESEIGKGSKFTLRFPTTNERASLITTHEPEQELSERSLRILVVDDEAAFCNVLDRFLSRGGNKVKTVNNGSDAISIVKIEDFDLVLCDLGMPDVSGFDVIKFINESKKRSKIGIITGWREEQKPIADSMYVDFIVRKPFDFSELTKQIDALAF